MSFNYHYTRRYNKEGGFCFPPPRLHILRLPRRQGVSSIC